MNMLDTSSTDIQQITRRIFLKQSAYIVTTTSFLGTFSQVNALNLISSEGIFFMSDELTLLVDVAEMMIPRTSTPGATDANVMPVLDAMMATWAGKKTQKQFKELPIQINLIAQQTYQMPYLTLSPERRFALLETLDQDAFASPELALSQSYRHFKFIVFHIFYSSEEANPNYSMMPGGYRGCLSEEEFNRITKQKRVDYV